jgi:hypothetical protein
MNQPCMHEWLEHDGDHQCRSCGLVVYLDRIAVGDRMRFSTELLRQIHDRPDHTTELLRVVKIGVASDGSKTVWLTREPESASES